MFRSFDLDAYAFAGIATATKAYAVNGLNQYTAVAGTGQTYDANGNLTGDGTNAYIYDGENRLVSATSAGVTATLTYDPLGRLWRLVKGASDTRFLYDGDALVAEYNSAGTLTQRYTHGSNMAADDPLIWYDGGATKRYLHADHLGSIVAATNAGIGAPAILSYDEYGVPGTGNVGRFQYTGQIWLSELGLYHYKARLYSPKLGRFLQVDPVGYVDQVNLYEYAGDDPVDGVDPTGEDWVFSQSTGQVVHVDNNSGEVTDLPGPSGYSGFKQYANQPRFEGVQGKGPIPKGTYTIGPPIRHITPEAMRLTPERGTDTHGRSAFLIHGDNRKGDRSASEGCIILGRDQRETIARSGDHRLRVISGPPPRPKPKATPGQPEPQEGTSMSRDVPWQSNHILNIGSPCPQGAPGIQISCGGGIEVWN